MKKFNWQIWAGFLLCLVSIILYPFVFVDIPALRDFPWLNLLLFAIAAVFLFIGLRRAFATGRPLRSKVAAILATSLSVLLIGLFVFSFFIMARWLPPSQAAPHVGQKAPEFRLTDTNGTQVALSELLTQPVNGRAPKGVLLVFYRGYW